MTKVRRSKSDQRRWNQALSGKCINLGCQNEIQNKLYPYCSERCQKEDEEEYSGFLRIQHALKREK